MRHVWVLLANASVLKIYVATRKERKITLQLLEEHTHPKSRAKETDLITKGSGHDHVPGKGERTGYQSKTSAKAHEGEIFAHQIAELLYQGKNTNRFQRLIISASPHFEGMLKKTLFTHHHVIKVDHFINKDYTKLTDKEIEEKLGIIYRPLLAT